MSDALELRATIADLGDAEVEFQLREREHRRRELAAEEAVLLAEFEHRKLFRRDAHARMAGFVRGALGWSGGEARTRLQLAHLCERHPAVLELLADGALPVGNAAELARAHANPRIAADVFDEHSGHLINTACRMEHADFRQVVERFVTLADTDGAHREAASVHERRNCSVTTFGDLTTVVAQLAGVDAAEFREILDRFADAEFRNDWDAAKAVLGDHVTLDSLARTDAQRRADALLAMARTAAGASTDVSFAKPVVNIVVDLATFTDHLTELGLFPERARDPWVEVRPLVKHRRCETEDGAPLVPAEVFQAAMAGHLRVLVANAEGQVVKMTSKQPLFRGAVRDAVMLQATRCTHPGCRVPASKSQGDHSVPRAHGGETTSIGGNPACGKHNRDRWTRGYRVTRDAFGWHTYRPDGTELC